jgi:hypothetical protein
MPDLSFRVEGAEAVPYSASPLLKLKLRVDNAVAGEAIHAVTLQCQIRIETTRRLYSEPERQRLGDLFGEPVRWSQTLRSLLWTHAGAVIPPFQDSTAVDLPVPCTFDFTVATAKYFNGLDGGAAPLSLLFSGTVFYEAADGGLQAAQIPWSKEAAYGLPVETWKRMMDLYYPNTAWLCLRRDVFDRLHQYKIDRGIPTWEEALESILP